MSTTTDNKKTKRSFKVHSVSKHENIETKYKGGRYIARDAAGAAKKAFNQLCRVKRIKGQCTLNISVRETTRNSKNKIYSYTAKRYKLKNPKVFKKGTPKEYTIQYDSKVLTNKTTDFNNLEKGKTRGRMKQFRKTPLKKKNKTDSDNTDNTANTP